MLAEVWEDVARVIAPVWPLRDYVAVNPWLNMIDRPLIEVRQELRAASDIETLMPLTYFRKRWQAGLISQQSLTAALSHDAPLSFGWQSQDLIAALTEASDDSQRSANDRACRTVAESLDLESATRWQAEITDHLSGFCAAHFDQGQASWTSPWRHLPLWQAWREYAAIDRRPEAAGVRGFRRLVAESLPKTAADAVTWILDRLGIPTELRVTFLRCQLLSIAGWAAHLQYRDQWRQPSGEQDTPRLLDLLAMRLAYDYGLVNAGLHPCWPKALQKMHVDRTGSGPRRDALLRSLLQRATEEQYGSELRSRLRSEPVQPASLQPVRPSAQVVLCIDVRSEVIRRHLEAQDASLETFGFAGFFGLSLHLKPLAPQPNRAQCPVLLQPQVRIEERSACGCHSDGCGNEPDSLRTRLDFRSAWQFFQTSASSTFTFVESIGISYGVKLLAAMLQPWRNRLANRSASQQSLDASASPVALAAIDWPLSQRIEAAAGILKNLGLRTGFSRLVVLCGHGTQTTNNPLQAGLDCGACGGHAGDVNARVVASLFNDPAVRDGLRGHGIDIPADTLFVATLHQTTTDEVLILDQARLPESHGSDLAMLQRAWQAAAAQARAERLQRSPDDLAQPAARAVDWSEVRPEWGLAGNAAFIAAPRWRTRGVDLQGRTFLHSYDPHLDTDGSVLELIMTAPLVVASWINMQYYASTVDNRNYGCGNKVLHNVVGQFGLWEGNGGDLRVGLPQQSLHDGRRLQHEPLRLNVLLDAPRDRIDAIVAKHAMVRDLIHHGWVMIHHLVDGQWQRYTAA